MDSRWSTSSPVLCSPYASTRPAANSIASATPFYAKRLTACRQDIHFRRSYENSSRQLCHGVDEMLASIEYEEHTLVSQIGGQTDRCIGGLNREPKYRGKRS